MPYGDNNWLALTQEPTLEPELPICDPHHHFWDLRPERMPYQRYLLHELVADVHCGHNVRATVFIETRAMYRPDGPVELRPVGEVEFVQGLSLDTGVCFPQLPELAAFATALPDLTIILNHLGGLTRVGPYGHRDDEVLATWRRGLAAVAACPNVSLKLGGIGMPRLGFDWHERTTPIGSDELATAMAPFMTYCIEQFGPAQCMFESNFPPDKVSFSHHVLFNAFKRFSTGYSASERAALFHDTAVRAYRISDV
jgi:predicted TIM-barrel fold metal-dependent hydrolase